MPLESPADYADSDPLELLLSDSTGRRWRLGFDFTTSPPTAVWEPVQTWGYMKTLFATWADAKRGGASWGLAKGF